jgi:4-amino-4-deoxy-L-arabinose transferase-like glycosyltransferase
MIGGMRGLPERSAAGRGALAAAAASFLAAACLCLGRPHPLGFLVGDGPYYAETAVSLAYDHDLDLRNQLQGGLAVHGPQIALGADGAWYPKHPILLPIAGMPFVLLFGVRGLLLLNCLVAAGVAACVYTLARRHTGPGAAATAVALLACGTFLHAYVYNLSPDLFAALLLALGCLALFDGRPWRAGLWLGATVFAKPLLVIVPPLALLHAWSQGRARAAFRLALGLLPAALALLLFNAAHFGSPFTTSYDRNVLLVEGRETVTSHRDQFNANPLDGAAGQLFDRRHGLLPTAPVILLAVPGLLILGRRRRAEAMTIAGTGLLLLAVLSPYRYWSTSHVGHRFFIPALALLAAPLALACEAAAAGVRRLVEARRSARGATHALAAPPPAP